MNIRCLSKVLHVSCKRDAMVAFKHGIQYVNENYGVNLEIEDVKCEYFDMNEQCIKDRCPYFN